MKNMFVWLETGMPKLEINIAEDKPSMAFAEAVRGDWKRELEIRKPLRILRLAFFTVVYGFAHLFLVIHHKRCIALAIIKFLWQEA